jgi:hypothetical protein
VKWQVEESIGSGKLIAVKFLHENYYLNYI